MSKLNKLARVTLRGMEDFYSALSLEEYLEMQSVYLIPYEDVDRPDASKCEKCRFTLECGDGSCILPHTCTDCNGDDFCGGCRWGGNCEEC